MPGKKGRTGRHTNRSNQWLAGTSERQRTDEVFAFKPRLAVIEGIKADIEERQISKTEWLDMAVECLLGLGDDDQSEISTLATPVNHPLIQDAIATSIEIKQAALRAEKKNKRPNQALIEKWRREISELEATLG